MKNSENTDISELENLAGSIIYPLKRAGIHTVKDFSNKCMCNLLKVNGIGYIRLSHLNEALISSGYKPINTCSRCSRLKGIK